MNKHTCIIPIKFCLLGALAIIAAPLVVVDDASAASVYLCQKNEKGRVRMVDSANKCRKNETAVKVGQDVDLSGIQDQIDDLDDRLWALEGVPTVVAAPLENLVWNGGFANGCELVPIGARGASPSTAIAECNSSGPGIITIETGHGARMRIAPDSDYVYDGLFLCMTVGDAAIARDDGLLGDTLRVRVEPLSLVGDPQTGTLTHIRSTGSTPTVRLLSLPSVDDSLLAEPDFTDPELPCQTFSFADGTNFSNPHFEFDTWSPPGEMLVHLLFPALDGRDHTNINDGDQVRIYQIGLTVAGRRDYSQ